MIIVRIMGPRLLAVYLRLVAWLEHPHAVSRVAVIAFLLSLPAAATGLVADDYWIEHQVQKDSWRGFDFFEPAAVQARRDAGYLAWWVDLRVHQSFLRPIASLTHALDFSLWPSRPAVMHVENSLLYAALICLVGALYAQLRFRRVVFGLATLFYAANGNHAMSVGWISGRNTLLAATFGLLALLWELRAAESAPGAIEPSTGSPNTAHAGIVPQSRRRTLRAFALIAYSCALLSAEIGVSVGGYLVAHALTLREGRLSLRLAGLWPYATVTIGWYAAHEALGYGAQYSGFYHEPMQEPGSFLATVFAGLPIYLATQLIGPLATFAEMFRHGLWIAALLSSALLWLMRGLLVPLLRVDPRARFLMLGALLSIAPLGSSMVQDRLVFFIGFGTAGFLALLVSQRLDPANRDLPRAGASVLFFNHALYLPVAFIATLMSTAHVNVIGGGTEALASALDHHANRPVVLVNMPCEIVSAFQDAIRIRRSQPALLGFDVLYSGLQPIQLVRSGERSLEVDVAAGYFSTPFERLTRNPSRNPFHVGDRIGLPRLFANVLEVNADGAPTRVRFDFPEPLERLQWLCWEGRTPVNCRPPAPSMRKSLPALSPM